MKFFTPEWNAGELPDDEHEAVALAYQVHVEALAPRLPEHLRSLATQVDLHDGLIRRILVDWSAARLVLALRCGDLQRGYFDFDLQYSGVDKTSLNTTALREVAENSNAEVLYDEVDRENDEVYVHRILFWIGRDARGGAYREIGVRFSDVDIQQTRRPDREIGNSGDRYEELDANAAS